MATRKTKNAGRRAINPLSLGGLEGLMLDVIPETQALQAYSSSFGGEPLAVMDGLDHLSRIAGIKPPEEYEAAVAEYRFQMTLREIPCSLGTDDPARLSNAALRLCHMGADGWESVGEREHQMWFDNAIPVLRLVQDEELRDRLATIIVERAASPEVEALVANLVLVCRGETHLRRGEVSVAIRHGRLVLGSSDADLEIVEAALSLLVECYYQKKSEEELDSALQEWWSLLKGGGSPATQSAAIDIKGVGNPHALAKAEEIRMVSSLLAMVMEESNRREQAQVVYDDLCAFGYDEWTDPRFEWAGTIADRRRHGSVPLLPADASTREDIPVRVVHPNSFGGVVDFREVERVINSLWSGPASFDSAVKLGRIPLREAVYLVTKDVSVNASVLAALLEEVAAEMVGETFIIRTRSVHDNGAESEMVVISHNLEARSLKGISLAVVPVQIDSQVELAVSALLFPDLKPSENERLRIAEVLSSKAESLAGFLAFRDQAMGAIREAGRRLRGAPMAVEAAEA